MLHGAQAFSLYDSSTSASRNTKMVTTMTATMATAPIATFPIPCEEASQEPAAMPKCIEKFWAAKTKPHIHADVVLSREAIPQHTMSDKV